MFPLQKDVGPPAETDTVGFGFTVTEVEAEVTEQLLPFVIFTV